MIQFLNNFWIAFTTENPSLINLSFIPLSFIENYLLMSLFLNALNVNTDKKSKVIYTSFMALIAIINSYIIPSPFNVIVNYICVLLLVKLIFKLNWLKSFMALVISTFIFGLLNILLQNPFMFIFNVDVNTISVVPIYRISYLLILYAFLFLISLFLKNFKRIKFNLDLFDNLDKNTIIILFINLLLGLLTLCMQLFITTYYVDILPISITLLNFVILTFFLLFSIFSFSRMIKLSITRRDLQNAEEYNKSLQILYDKVKGFKHDSDNIISTLGGYLDNNDINGAKSYFYEVKRDCKITNNLAVLNPSIINDPGIYSLLNNKYFKASELGINISLELFLDLSTLKVNTYKFSRAIGILLDNAIEAASECNEKIIRIVFRRENKNKRALIIVENTYSNKDVNTEEIFKKGVSGKEKHSGIGLWEIRNYIRKTPNLNLFTTKDDKFFKQQLEIYDEIRNIF